MASGTPCTASDLDQRGTISLPVLSREHNPRGTVRRSRSGRRRAIVLATVQLLIIGHIVLWLLSRKYGWFGGRTITPVEPSESMEFAKNGVANAGLIFFALTLASTLIMGRWFCGWACHVVLLQDLCSWIMKKMGVRPKPFRSRLLIYVPLLLALYMFIWPAFYRLVRRGAVTAHRAEIVEYAPGGLVLSNGDKLDVDLVVLGTGWRTDYGLLPADVRARLDMADDGFYLYRHMLQPALPNLAFIGSAATICSILTYSLQARWLAELLAGNHRLPEPEAMAREIAEMQAWKRAWMPFSHARGARLILHMLHYHDELLKDFGANPRRKTGLFAPLKELFAPYGPSDYRSIVSGAWKEEGGRIFG